MEPNDRPDNASASNPDHGSDEELSLGRFGLIKRANYHCTKCDTVFGMVLSAVPAERKIDLAAFQEVEQIEKEMKASGDESLRKTITNGIRLYLKARKIERDEVRLPHRLKAILDRAHSSLTASCPKCGSWRVRRIKYSEIVPDLMRHTEEAGELPLPGTKWICDSTEGTTVVVKRKRGKRVT